MNNATLERRDGRSFAAEAAFRARLAELGATLLEPHWLGHRVPHLVRCAAGHECTPRPNNVQQGWGICRVCARNDPATAEAAYRRRLAELGATLLEPVWLGTGEPHRVRCSAGHLCTPRPTHVLRGKGVCRTCAGQDPAVTEAAFRARLAELGAVLLEPAYLGSSAAHRAICAEGHPCTPNPKNVQRRGHVCLVCSGLDPATAEAAFRRRLADLGAILLEPAYLGSDVPHRVRCAAGHLCAPRPHSMQQGQGICFPCSRSFQDAVYVVRHITQLYVKFGITNGNGRNRLGDHARDGYRDVLRYYKGLPNVAAEIEQATIRALADAGMRPIKGREYYDIATLPLILNVIDERAAEHGATSHLTKEDR